jgi:hypothetical protein
MITKRPPEDGPVTDARTMAKIRRDGFGLLGVPRDTDEYLSGKNAFLNRPCDWSMQSKECGCPFGIGDSRRVGWITGWLDERSRARCGPIFDKYNVRYP